MNVEEVQLELRAFAQERDWEQFHTPKNLAMALAAEAGELLEVFQWLTPEQSRAVMASESSSQVVEEIADILIYTLRLADVLDIDLASAVTRKIDSNAEKYPSDVVRGSAAKYTEYE